MYWLLKHGEAYVRQEADAYEQAYRARVVKGLSRRAAELGFRLEAVPAATVPAATGLEQRLLLAT